MQERYAYCVVPPTLTGGHEPVRSLKFFKHVMVDVTFSM